MWNGFFRTPMNRPSCTPSTTGPSNASPGGVFSGGTGTSPAWLIAASFSVRATRSPTFIPNSEACARAIGWCCPKHKIHVVPNGIPDKRVVPSRSAADVRKELDIPEQALIFTYVGNNKPAKGIEPLLKAFAVARLDAHLVLVGDPGTMVSPMHVARHRQVRPADRPDGAR